MSRLFPRAPPRTPLPRADLARAQPRRPPTPRPKSFSPRPTSPAPLRATIEWRNPHGDYWRTERVAGRFEAMAVRGREGGTHWNTFSYVVFDYEDKECSCKVIRKSKGGSIESAKLDAEREIRIRMAGLL